MIVIKFVVIKLFIIFLLFHNVPVRSDLDTDKICGYGTARCRRNCKREEFRIGTCPNTSKCCLKKWNAAPLNPVKH
nr:PREDICTED: beta-defensin 104A-like [Rhinolophus sinicus]